MTTDEVDILAEEVDLFFTAYKTLLSQNYHLRKEKADLGREAIAIISDNLAMPGCHRLFELINKLCAARPEEAS